jgi:hypothetical protein
MILTLDTLGERYSMLPSEVLCRASTLDLYVMDVALSYHDHQRKKSENKADASMYDTEQLKEMLAKTRRNIGGNNG